MQESKFPPGYVQMTHHSLSGFSPNGEGRVSKSRSNGDQNYNTGGQNRGRQQRPSNTNGPKRRNMKPRMNAGGRD